MDILAHLTGLSLIAAIITGMGVALAALHAVALRLSVRHWPRRWLAAGVVAVPFLGWMGFGLYLLSLMAADG